MESSSTSLRPLILDLALLAAIRKVAEEVNSWPEPIDVLINNAAIRANPRRELTVDCFESQFATNHLGHFIFTNLPSLVSPPPTSDLASSTSPPEATVARRFDLTTSTSPRRALTVPFQAYGQSKTANMLFSVELTKRWKNVGATSFSSLFIPGSSTPNSLGS